MLAQQVFPVLSGVIKKLIYSKDYKIVNKPVYVINLNEENLTPAIAVNILSSNILEFRYLDIYDRNISDILRDAGYLSSISNIRQYDVLLSEVNKRKENEFFVIDEENKQVKFLKTRLKDGINVNNEPYWFVLKAYAAVYMSLKENYKINMDDINSLRRGNKTF